MFWIYYKYKVYERDSPDLALHPYINVARLTMDSFKTYRVFNYPHSSSLSKPGAYISRNAACLACSSGVLYQ